MIIHNECKIEDGVKWELRVGHGHMEVIATNLKTNRHKICEYECPYNFRDGYSMDDCIGIYQIIADFVEELK